MKTYNTQFEITNAVLDVTAKDLGLNLTERAILLQVTRGLFKDEKTQTFISKVSQGEIATFVGSKRSTVNSKLQKFEDMGILCSKQRYNTSKVYTWVALPTDTARVDIAKANRDVSKELRSKLVDISKLTQTELLNIDKQIKAIDLCKGDRLFSIKDFTPLKLNGNFSYEIKAINNKCVKATKDILRQGYNIDNSYEVQKLDDLEKCSGYVLYKSFMTKRLDIISEDTTQEDILPILPDDFIPEPILESPPDFDQPPLDYYNNIDFDGDSREYFTE